MSDAPYSLMDALSGVREKGKPPIHLWHPENVKDIDMVIKSNGDWFHEGGKIERSRLVHLFASVLRREQEEYFLVTPVEKCKIQVEDVPFQGVLLVVSGTGKSQTLTFTTNVADEVVASDDNKLRFEGLASEPRTYLHVRDGLEAILNRNVYYQLMDLLVEEMVSGKPWLGLWSDGAFFPAVEAES